VYTLGGPERARPYEIAVVRSALTRNYGDLFSDTRDEIVTAFDDVLGLNGKGTYMLAVLEKILKPAFLWRRMEKHSGFGRYDSNCMQS